MEPIMRPTQWNEPAMMRWIDEASARLEKLANLTAAGNLAIDETATGYVLRALATETAPAEGADGWSGPFAVRVEADGEGENATYHAIVYDSSNPESGVAGRVSINSVGSSSVSEEAATTTVENVAGMDVMLRAKLYRGYAGSDDSGKRVWRIAIDFEAVESGSPNGWISADGEFCARLAHVSETGAVEQIRKTGDVVETAAGYFGPFRILCRDGVVQVFNGADPDSDSAGGVSFGGSSYAVEAYSAPLSGAAGLYLVGVSTDEDVAFSIETGDEDGDEADGADAWRLKLGAVSASGSVSQEWIGGNIEISTPRWT